MIKIYLKISEGQDHTNLSELSQDSPSPKSKYTKIQAQPRHGVGLTQAVFHLPLILILEQTEVTRTVLACPRQKRNNPFSWKKNLQFILETPLKQNKNYKHVNRQDYLSNN